MSCADGWIDTDGPPRWTPQLNRGGGSEGCSESSEHSAVGFTSVVWLAKLRGLQHTQVRRMGALGGLRFTDFAEAEQLIRGHCHAAKSRIGQFGSKVCRLCHPWLQHGVSFPNFF